MEVSKISNTLNSTKTAQIRSIIVHFISLEAMARIDRLCPLIEYIILHCGSEGISRLVSGGLLTNLLYHGKRCHRGLFEILERCNCLFQLASSHELISFIIFLRHWIHDTEAYSVLNGILLMKSRELTQVIIDSDFLRYLFINMSTSVCKEITSRLISLLHSFIVGNQYLSLLCPDPEILAFLNELFSRNYISNEFSQCIAPIIITTDFQLLVESGLIPNILSRDRLKGTTQCVLDVLLTCLRTRNIVLLEYLISNYAITFLNNSPHLKDKCILEDILITFHDMQEIISI